MVTKILPSGIETKTGYIPEFLTPNLSLHERHFVELDNEVNPFQGINGERPSNSMLDAVFALGAAFKNEGLAQDPFFIKFKHWLASFELRVVGWELKANSLDGESYSPAVRFSGTKLQEPLVYDFDDPGPTTEVLGQTLNRNDLVAFTHYLMTNTGPEGPDDPRYAFIQSLKQDEPDE